MARKYIQNCTGDNCEMDGGVKKTNLISKKISRIIFYILLVGFLSVTLYVVFFSPYLEISKVTIDGTQELNKSELQQKIDDFLQGKFFGIIPRNNFIFVSQKRIENILMGDFKKIRSVSVIKKFPDSVAVNIDERKALLVWCSNEKCFLIDENGFAYNEADFNSPELQQNHLLQINEEGGEPVTLNEKVIENDYEQYVLSIKDDLNRIGYDATDQYSTPSRMAQEIKVTTSQGPKLYLSTQFSLESAMKILTTLFKKEITGDMKNNLEYIDLRNETKIFYKFNGQQVQAPPVETQAVPIETIETKKSEKKK